MRELERLCLRSGIIIKTFNDNAYISYGLDEWLCHEVREGLYTLKHCNTKFNSSKKYNFHGQVKKANGNNQHLVASEVIVRILEHSKVYKRIK
jgi:sorbitol-specific phosphotransferase system component IIA